MSRFHEEKDRFLILLSFLFFFTCQPSSGLKQLITEVQQQVLTGHAQKHGADSEEDASSHHPLTQTYFRLQVKTEISVFMSTVFLRDQVTKHAARRGMQP